MTEAEIIEKLQAGNEQAFKTLVEQYQKPVVNTCFGILHDKDDAEDVAQEVFIEVFRSVKNFRADSKISTWLYRIAVNRSLNFLRDNKKRKWFQSFEDAVKSQNTRLEKLTAENHEDAGFNLENNQRANMLHEAMNALPKNQKIAFTLNKYEDLSYKEISQVMDLSISSVESLIHRAKKSLQKKLYVCYKKRCI
jgi:RNA polymerase sigma-70 factor (ECF subfamily)